MPLKERFVKRNIFIGPDVRACHALHNPVHQQKGVAVRQQAQNALYVHARILGGGILHGGLLMSCSYPPVGGMKKGLSPHPG